MTRNDVVKLLQQIREDMDELKNYDTDFMFNEGIERSMIIVEKQIEEYSKTPNDFKKESGLYHN